MKKSKKSIDISKLKLNLKGLKIEKKEKALEKEKEGKSEKNEKSEKNKEIKKSEKNDLSKFSSHILNDLESLSSKSSESIEPSPAETAEEIPQEEKQSQSIIFSVFPTDNTSSDFSASTKFIAPVLDSSDKRLEETAQSSSTFQQPKQTMDINAGGTQRGYSTSSSYSNPAEYESRGAYERPRRERFEPERRFDIREGLIADAARVVSATPTIPPVAGGWDRASPQRAELEEFAGEQKKYKERVQEETLRRKRRG